MKTTIQIRTADFEYIMQEFDKELTPDEAVEAFNALQKAYNGGFGLDPKDFNACLDRYLTDGTGETEKYHEMNKQQQWLFQQLKKSLKRTGAQEDREADAINNKD